MYRKDFMHANRFATRVFIALLFLSVILAPTAAGGNRESGEDSPQENATGDSESAAVSSQSTDGERLSVVATTNFIGDVVANIAGDAVNLTVLVPTGQNPHAYEPTPRALVTVERADLIFVNGLDLEENLMDVIETSSGGAVVAVSDGIDVLEEEDEDHDDDDHEEDDHGEDDHEEDDHHHAEGDPHVWFSPLSILVWIDNIEGALVAADPSREETFRSNAAEYRRQVTALDEEIRRRAEGIPRERRKLVIDHASLGYFARDYDFTVLGSVIPGTTDQAEPSARAVSELVTLVRTEEVPAIFVGGTASRGLRNLVEAVAAEVGRDVQVRTLLTGSLAASGEPGDTYLGFMEYNITQIMEGLGY
jgi:ABC-type Zn uptake system ZnuABC Zn-binding protein ZnuA